LGLIFQVFFINSFAAALLQKCQPQKYGTECWENLISYVKTACGQDSFWS